MRRFYCFMRSMAARRMYRSQCSSDRFCKGSRVSKGKLLWPFHHGVLHALSHIGTVVGFFLRKHFYFQMYTNCVFLCAAATGK